MPTNPEQFLKEKVEECASLEHDRWAKWQKYMHSKIAPTEHDALMQIGTEFIERWNRQIATPYSALTEKEKESDREQVRPYLPVFIECILLGLTIAEGEVPEEEEHWCGLVCQYGEGVKEHEQDELRVDSFNECRSAILSRLALKKEEIEKMK